MVCFPMSKTPPSTLSILVLCSRFGMVEGHCAAYLFRTDVGAQKRAKNPSFITKLTRRGSIEQEAVEALTAKKQLEEQRYELQQFIKFRHGVQAWNELLRMEGDIRKRRQKEIYDKQVLRQKIITVIVLILCVIVGMGILLAFIYGLVQLDRGNIG